MEGRREIYINSVNRARCDCDALFSGSIVVGHVEHALLTEDEAELVHTELENDCLTENIWRNFSAASETVDVGFPLEVDRKLGNRVDYSGVD